MFDPLAGKYVTFLLPANEVAVKVFYPPISAIVLGFERGGDCGD